MDDFTLEFMNAAERERESPAGSPQPAQRIPVETR